LLSTIARGEQIESIVCAIEELDRLTEFLNKSPRPTHFASGAPRSILTARERFI
jgi:hypothetical protein